MTREEFIEEYYLEMGEYPSEQEIREFLGEGYVDSSQNLYDDDYRFNNHRFQNSMPRNANCTNALINEVKSIFENIAGNAKVSIKSKTKELNNNDQVQEFCYMALTFICKASLFFLLKNSYSKGYDFSNL